MTDDKFQMAQGSYTELGNLFILFVSSLLRTAFPKRKSGNQYVSVRNLSFVISFGDASRQS
jgi:hypothetical protein